MPQMRCEDEENEMPLQPGIIEDDAEAVKFDAETHIQQIEEVFNIFNTELREWLICSIADNCRVNKKIARLLGVPHVGSLSHKLNLELKAMVNSDRILSTTIDSIHSTMLNCKQKLKNRDMLRNLTALSPILHNKTRWTSKYTMLKRFNRIRDHLLILADTEGAVLTINRTIAFKNQSNKYEKMFEDL